MGGKKKRNGCRPNSQRKNKEKTQKGNLQRIVWGKKKPVGARNSLKNKKRDYNERGRKKNRPAAQKKGIKGEKKGFKIPTSKKVHLSDFYQRHGANPKFSLSV